MPKTEINEVFPLFLRPLLPTPRAREKAKAELAALEARIGELERQREDAAEVVAAACREMSDLRQAIESAKVPIRSESGERALRRWAEAFRSVIQRIECTFTATGHTGAAPVTRTPGWRR